MGALLPKAVSHTYGTHEVFLFSPRNQVLVLDLAGVVRRRLTYHFLVEVACGSITLPRSCESFVAPPLRRFGARAFGAPPHPPSTGPSVAMEDPHDATPQDDEKWLDEADLDPVCSSGCARRSLRVRIALSRGEYTKNVHEGPE
jgi:hypothetical protein